MAEERKYFDLVNHEDPQQAVLLTANNVKDAALEALELLGWGIFVRNIYEGD